MYPGYRTMQAHELELEERLSPLLCLSVYHHCDFSPFRFSLFLPLGAAIRLSQVKFYERVVLQTSIHNVEITRIKLAISRICFERKSSQ